MASLTWTDALGSATLANGLAVPASRFAAWRPLPGLVQDEDESLPGVRYTFPFGALYEASFALPLLAHADHPLAVRFMRHALSGATFGVVTDDGAARTYPTCQTVKGAPPTLEMTDRRLRRWTLTLPRVRNVAAAPVELLCLY